MKNRLFYTNEKNENLLFHYCLWFQPSDGWLLVQENIDSCIISVFLDERYFEKTPLISTKELWERFWKRITISIIKRDKKLRELLKPFVVHEVVVEKSLSQYVYEHIDKDFGVVFEEESWQNLYRIRKTNLEKEYHWIALSMTNILWNWIWDNLDAFIWKSEIAVRGMIINQAMILWLEDEAFPTIVAFWKNSAIPHHKTSRDIIAHWPLLIDMGWKRNWYCSDMTRCFWLWEKNEEYEKRNITLTQVKHAHQLWLKLAKSWTITWDIASKIRDYFTKEWVEQYFTHSLGHWVWLDVHENPHVHKESKDILEEGMVITIEPWLYFPGQFWIRREDTLILAKQ